MEADAEGMSWARWEAGPRASSPLNALCVFFATWGLVALLVSGFDPQCCSAASTVDGRTQKVSSKLTVGDLFRLELQVSGCGCQELHALV